MNIIKFCSLIKCNFRLLFQKHCSNFVKSNRINLRMVSFDSAINHTWKTISSSYLLKKLSFTKLTPRTLPPTKKFEQKILFYVGTLEILISNAKSTLLPNCTLLLHCYYQIANVQHLLFSNSIEPILNLNILIQNLPIRILRYFYW